MFYFCLAASNCIYYIRYISLRGVSCRGAYAPYESIKEGHMPLMNFQNSIFCPCEIALVEGVEGRCQN